MMTMLLKATARQLACPSLRVGERLTRPFLIGRATSSLRSLREEISRFDSSLGVNAAHTPPGSWYVDERFHEIEKETVFGRNWVAVCGAHHMKEPGDFVTGFLGDEPYLITRDQPEDFRYFYNVCRHHGTLLCDAAKGHAAEFVCPYHAWKYGLDGRLTMAKRLRHIENFRAKDHGLKRFSGTNWFGCLFLNQQTDADEAEFHKQLDGLKHRFNELGCTQDNLVHIETRVFTQNCNWKVAIDNYLDGGYHVPICHKDLNEVLDEDSYKTEVFDGFSIQSTGGTDSKSRVGDKAIFVHIYPNIFLNRYGNWLDVNYVIPTSPQTCEVTFDWYMDKDVINGLDDAEGKRMIADSIVNSVQVQDEDTEICQRVQKGMRSRSFTHGRYAPLLEHAMHDFHCRLAKDYESII